MGRNRQLIISVLALLSLALVTTGVSYSLLDYDQEKASSQSKLVYQYQPTVDGSQVITLKATRPSTDKEGKKLLTDGNYFHFTIDTSVEKGEEIPYGIVLSKDPSSTLSNELIKVYLTEVVNGVEYPVSTTVEKNGTVKVLSDLAQSDMLNEWYTYSLDEGVAESDGKGNFHKEYNLRVWINGDSEIAPTVSTDGTLVYPYQGQQAMLKVILYQK